MRLINRALIPPSLCTYVDEKMERVVVAGNFDDLVLRVVDLRKFNHLDVPADIETVVERQIAEHAPEQLVVREEGDSPVRPLDMRSPSVQMRTAKLKDAGQRVGGLLTDPFKARARAETCLKCPKHLPIDCLSCSGVLDWMLSVHGITEWEDIDKKLQGCSCMGWYVKVMCNIRLQTFLEMGLGMKKIEMLPDDCWLKTESLGKTGDSNA